MSALTAALFALGVVAILFAIVLTTTIIDRRKARRVPMNYDAEGA